MLAATAGLALLGLAWPASAAGLTSPAPAGLRVVHYLGYRFEVPRSWPVIRISRDPATCVRFDLHAVYLGSPGVNENCPSWLVGTTEAVLIQPAAAAARLSSVENPVSNQIVATAPRITVTATFDTDPTTDYRILASAGLAAPVIAAANPARLAASLQQSETAGPVTADAVSASPEPDIVFGVEAPELPATVGNDVGLGFDVCATPSPAYMSAWRRHSAYRAVGIYIGGSDRACDQQNLTASWVRREAAAGWRFIPMYVGPQASFSQLTDPARQAVAAAADAAVQAQRLGFGPQTPLYYDMEAYPAAQTGRALAFLSAWTTELHRLGYRSGVYSSSESGIADLAGAYRSGRLAMPDAIYDALWNGSQNVSDPVYRRGEWAGQRRLHQFSGNVLQTFGGDTMDIDQDYLDLDFTAAGGTEQAAPGTSQPDRSASIFYEGADHRLWEEIRSARGSWSRIDLGGDLSSPPSVVQTGGSDLAVIYRGGNGELTVRRLASGRWQPAQVLPQMGIVGPAPRAVAQPNGVIDVFWAGHYDRHLWHAQFNPGQGWSGPQPLSGSLSSSPYPVESGSGVVQVFWQGTDGRLWRVVRALGQPWTRPQSLGMAPMGGPPHAVEQKDGEVDVFWRGAIPHTIWAAFLPSAGRVTGPVNLGSQVTGEPWPVIAAGRERVFFRGPRGQLLELSRGRGGRWSRASSVAKIGHLTSAPFAATGGAGDPVELFWTGAPAQLWSASFTQAGGWRGPVDLGGRVQ
jgi:Domain of unknown function (DUF1906)